MQDAKTISTSRVKLHLDMAKASGMHTAAKKISSTRRMSIAIFVYSPLSS